MACHYHTPFRGGRVAGEGVAGDDVIAIQDWEGLPGEGRTSGCHLTDPEGGGASFRGCTHSITVLTLPDFMILFQIYFQHTHTKKAKDKFSAFSFIQTSII